MTAWQHLLIEHGATVELEHAASLGLLAEIEHMVERDPEILKRPKIMKALIGGTATKESPLQAVRRRGGRKSCLISSNMARWMCQQSYSRKARVKACQATSPEAERSTFQRVSPAPPRFAANGSAMLAESHDCTERN